MGKIFDAKMAVLLSGKVREEEAKKTKKIIDCINEDKESTIGYMLEEIKLAAKEGKTEWEGGPSYSHDYWPGYDSRLMGVIKNACIWESVIKEIKGLGFKIRFKEVKKWHVPGGLGRNYTGVIFKVRW